MLGICSSALFPSLESMARKRLRCEKNRDRSLSFEVWRLKAWNDISVPLWLASGNLTQRTGKSRFLPGKSSQIIDQSAIFHSLSTHQRVITHHAPNVRIMRVRSPWIGYALPLVPRWSDVAGREKDFRKPPFSSWVSTCHVSSFQKGIVDIPKFQMGL